MFVITAHSLSLFEQIVGIEKRSLHFGKRRSMRNIIQSSRQSLSFSNLPINILEPPSCQFRIPLMRHRISSHFEPRCITSSHLTTDRASLAGHLSSLESRVLTKCGRVFEDAESRIQTWARVIPLIAASKHCKCTYRESCLN